MEIGSFASNTQVETADFVITVDFFLPETVIVFFDNCQTYNLVEIARFDLRRLSVHIRDVPVSKRGRVTSHRYPD
jgi:hypothetical protein